MNYLQFNYISRTYNLIHINASNNIMVVNQVNILSPALFLKSKYDVNNWNDMYKV